MLKHVTCWTKQLCVSLCVENVRMGEMLIKLREGFYWSGTWLGSVQTQVAVKQGRIGVGKETRISLTERDQFSVQREPGSSEHLWMDNIQIYSFIASQYSISFRIFSILLPSCQCCSQMSQHISSLHLQTVWREPWHHPGPRPEHVVMRT